ncbi:hypothetical protein MY3296_000271 [Beauveria thailandica]
MEDEPPQAVRNCRTCKRDLPEVKFQSVKDPTKFTRQRTSCRVRQKERVAESRAAAAFSRDRKRASDEPYFFSAANNLDFGEVPSNLPDLTMAEEMLVAGVKQ